MCSSAASSSLLLGSIFLKTFPQKVHKLVICIPLLWHKLAIIKTEKKKKKNLFDFQVLQYA